MKTVTRKGLQDLIRDLLDARVSAHIAQTRYEKLFFETLEATKNYPFDPNDHLNTPEDNS